MRSRRHAEANICWCTSFPPHAVMIACTIGRLGSSLLLSAA
jgi:hypothetical protein